MAAATSAGIRVEGAKQLRRTLRKAGDDLTELKAAHGKAAGLVATAARPRTPHRTGRLAASVRPGATKTSAIIRAGKAAVPYANPIHWGWPSRHIAAQPWLSATAQETEPRWTALYDAAVTRVLDTIKGA